MTASAEEKKSNIFIFQVVTSAIESAIETAIEQLDSAKHHPVETANSTRKETEYEKQEDPFALSNIFILQAIKEKITGASQWLAGKNGHPKEETESQFEPIQK